MAGHKKGKACCGVILTEHRCEDCDAISHIEEHQVCRRCGKAINYWCARAVHPGQRCDKHTGRTDVAEDAPTTLLGYLARREETPPELRSVIAGLYAKDDPTEALRVLTLWLTSRAAQTGNADHARVATEAAKKWADVQAARRGITVNVTTNGMDDLSGLSDAELAEVAAHRAALDGILKRTGQ